MERQILVPEGLLREVLQYARIERDFLMKDNDMFDEYKQNKIKKITEEISTILDLLGEEN